MKRIALIVAGLLFIGGLGWLFMGHPVLVGMVLGSLAVIGFLLYFFPSMAVSLGEKFGAGGNNIYGNIALGLVVPVILYPILVHGLFIERASSLSVAEQIADNIKSGHGYGTDADLGFTRVSPNQDWLTSWEWAVGLSLVCLAVFVWSRTDEIALGYRRVRRRLSREGDRPVDLPTPEAEKAARRVSGAAPGQGTGVRPAGGITFGQRIVAESSGEMIGEIAANAVTSIVKTFTRRS